MTKKSDLPLNFDLSDRILLAINKSEEAIRSVYLVRCQPTVVDPYYHTFEEIQEQVPFKIDFSHLNPLHVLPCGISIETQAVFKEAENLVETDEKGGE